MSSPRRPRLSLTPLEDRWTPATVGAPDPGFGSNGVTTIPIPDFAHFVSPNSLVVTPTGGVVVSGTAQSVAAPFELRAVLTRFTADGRLDPTFGSNGQEVLPTPVNSLDGLQAVAVLPDGRLILLDTDAPTTVRRLAADGTPDPTFGNDGVVTLPNSIGDQTTHLAALPDGRLVVATDDGTAMVVMRLLSDGQPDPTFGDTGVGRVTVPLNGTTAQPFVYDVGVLPDGRVVVAGSAVVGTTQAPIRGTAPVTDPVVARLLADGRPDPGFGSGGVVRLDTPGVSDGASNLVALPDGRVVFVITKAVAGAGLTATRLTADGHTDPSYGTDGETTVSANTVVTLPDGRLVFKGGDSSSRLQRLTADGQPDPTFPNTPRADIPTAGGEPAALPDGSVFLIGFQDGNTQVVKVAGATTAFPLPAGTVAAGGTADGQFTPLVPGADGLQPATPVSVYPNFGGTARTATADVTGDGVADQIIGPGPGGGPNVVVLDGKTGLKVANLDVFEGTFTGGVFVAAADLNGDGKAEVIVTPDQGGGPVAVIYDGAKLAAGQNDAAQLTRFFGIDDPAFRGGARPAVGDVNGDGKPDLVVAAGFGGGPRVAVFDGRTALTPPAAGQLPPKLAPDFFVFEPTLRNGVYVASGDLTGDGAAEVIVGGGPGGGPRVFALDGRALVGGTQTPVANFFAGDGNSRGGVRVAVVPDTDGKPQLVTGSGDGEAARVRVYSASGARAGTAAQELAPFNGATLADGVYVG